jgi:hypothetical protein
MLISICGCLVQIRGLLIVAAVIFVVDRRSRCSAFVLDFVCGRLSLVGVVAVLGTAAWRLVMVSQSQFWLLFWPSKFHALSLLTTAFWNGDIRFRGNFVENILRCLSIFF